MNANARHSAAASGHSPASSPDSVAPHRDQQPAEGDRRETLIGQLTRIVREITHAECAFVRRLNPDGTAEIVGKPTWNGESVGAPPPKKQPGEGISGLVLKNRQRTPEIIRDVHDRSNSNEYLEAHRKTFNAWPEGSPAWKFTHFIRSEVCIPLVYGDEYLGAVVAVSGEVIHPGAVAELQREIEFWQPCLTQLYLRTQRAEDPAPGPNQDHARDFDAVRIIVARLPEAAANANERVFFRQMATMLTAHAGLRWHRAMIFVLDGRYPCDARCVAALGGTGGDEWPLEQQRVSASLPDLAACLIAATKPDFAANDPLMQAAANPDAPWIIGADSLAAHDEIHAVLTDKRAGGQGGTPQGAALLSKHDPWLARAAQGLPLFAGLAAQCDHLLVPLMVPKPTDEGFRAIGFVILDRPYCDAVGQQAALSSTSFICDLLASLVAAHVADRSALQRHAADALDRFLADPGVREEAAQRVRSAKRRIQYWSR